jgi:hypothetical protein
MSHLRAIQKAATFLAKGFRIENSAIQMMPNATVKSFVMRFKTPETIPTGNPCLYGVTVSVGQSQLYVRDSDKKLVWDNHRNNTVFDLVIEPDKEYCIGIPMGRTTYDEPRVLWANGVKYEAFATQKGTQDGQPILYSGGFVGCFNSSTTQVFPGNSSRFFNGLIVFEVFFYHWQLLSPETNIQDREQIQLWNGGRFSDLTKVYSMYGKANIDEMNHLWLGTNYNGTHVMRDKFHSNIHHIFHPIQDYTHSLTFKNKLATIIKGTVSRLGDAYEAQSSLLKDFIYEGQTETLNGLNLTGAWGRADSTSTDMPASWEGKTVNLSGNKQGGMTSTETTPSVITNAKCANYYGNSQTPAGYDTQDYELAANHTYLHFHSARKKQLRITSLGNVVRTISQLYFYSNLLEQDIATVYDPAIIQAGTIHGYNNTGLFGTIPRPSDNCTDLRLYGCSLTGLPLDFNNVATLYLYGNQLAGTLIANKASTIYLGASTTANSVYQTGVGNIGVDLRNQAVNISLGLFTGCKVNALLLPITSGRIFETLRIQNNPDLIGIDFTGVTWVMFPGNNSFTNFQANSCNLNQTFPLGSVIASTNIHLQDNAMTTPNVNATMDSAIDNQVNFADATVVKTISIGGTNAAITNDGRPDRISLTLQMVEDKNFILHANISYYRINSVAFVADTLTDIIVTLNGAPNWTANGTISASVTNTTQYNAVWTIISRGTDTGASNGSNGVYYRLRLAGFDHTGKTSETGVISLA